eukprot:11215096-Lingulodinium_polyedra.AAC.1
MVNATMQFVRCSPEDSSIVCESPQVGQEKVSRALCQAALCPGTPVWRRIGGRRADLLLRLVS